MKNLKKAMPQINIKNKGDADLYFEFLEPKERKEFYEDLIGEDQPNIKLPDFGKIDHGPEISNEVKEMNESELSENAEDLIKRFVKDKHKPAKPFLEYDDQKHRFELKPKYDIEKMLQEVVKPAKI